MKTLPYLYLIICLAPACLPKKIKSIQINYFGEQSKPHGDLIISLKKYVLPTDKSIGFVFGQNLITDRSTFMYILWCLRRQHFRNLRKEEGFYAIEANRKYIIPISSAEIFFDSLGRQIQLKKLDSAVGDALIHYDQHWQGRKSIATATREDVLQYFFTIGLSMGVVFVKAPILSKEILTSQNKYRGQFSKEGKATYAPIIRFSKKWTGKIVKQFVETQSPIFRKLASLNYVVEYNDSSSSLVTWIWTSKDRIYRYENPAVNKGEFKTYDLYDLAPEEKRVIKYFMAEAGDKSKYDTTVNRPVQAGNYYLGSKIDTGRNKKAKTFAF